MKRILMVNKFLYPNGGSETYIFEIGKQLQKMGYEIQYFGMRDDRNVVGNDAGSYTKNMDFHSGKLQKLLYPFRIIYSSDARRAIRKVLDQFQPDVVHLNNFNFQLTPSIIYEIRSFDKSKGKKTKIIYTAHDYQLVCPNHMLRCPMTDSNCEKCIDGNYKCCMAGKCIHGSTVKSMLGSMEGYLYKWLGTYRQIDTVICPSAFLKKKLDHNPALRGKTVIMQNFSTVCADKKAVEKEAYVLYFGRYFREKGVDTLLQVCRELPDISFKFAGSGPMEESVNAVDNVENLGFLQGEELEMVIRKASFSVYPSEWYENCPFSVMESIQYGTPVLGANIGGIPELINDGVTGALFESGNKEELKRKIEQMYRGLLSVQKGNERYINEQFTSLEKYCEMLIGYYS